MLMTPVARPAPPSQAARRLVGASVLLLTVIAMAPWLAVNAAVSAVVLGAQALTQAPHALLRAIDYAGEVAFGG